MLLAVAVGVSGVALWVHWGVRRPGEHQDRGAYQMCRPARKRGLDQLKQQVDNFEKAKSSCFKGIGVIEGLQRNRTGGQELLEAIANTVSRTDTLWLTSVERKGDALTHRVGGIHQRGREYITQLRRSGYFQTVEIKESHQNDNAAVQLL